MKKRILVFLFVLLIFIGLFIFLYEYFKMQEDIIYEEINANFTLNKISKVKEKKITIEENITEVSDEENTNIEENEKIEKEIYTGVIGVLEIPKISLKRNLYTKDSDENTIAKNVKVMNEANFPDIDKGNFILAAHSGTGRIAFFKDLHNLNISDKVFVYYNNYKYEYEIKVIYDETKDGTIALKKDPNETVITLITCKYKDKTKQTIFVGNLINKEKI